MTKIFTFILLLFSTVTPMFVFSSAVANSAPPISTNQHDQSSANNPSEQHRNRPLKDIVIKRDNPHERWSKRDKSDSNATDPHQEIVTVPLLSW